MKSKSELDGGVFKNVFEWMFFDNLPRFLGVRKPQNNLKASGNYAYGDSSHSK